MLYSGTHKPVALSITEAELYAAVSTVQDMLYMMNVLLSIGLFTELPMVLEVANMGAVHLSNNWSVSGCTGHIDVQQYFLRESKENNLLIVKWVPDTKHVADIFTKNLFRPQVEEFAKVFVKEDLSTPEPE